jgi:integrase
LGQKKDPPMVYTAPNIKMLMLDESGNVREGFLERHQYEAMRQELPDHQRLILVIGYHLGMRRGEILGLRWDQVDWQANLIRLEKKQTKGKKSRVAPLYGELRSWLDNGIFCTSCRLPDHWSWRGTRISDVKTAWINARKRAGVPGLLVHDLRRTAAQHDPGLESRKNK